MLKVETTSLPGVLLVHPPTQFEDFRGTYTEIYNQEVYSTAGIADEFIQDCSSVSQLNVLRGIHGDGATTKLVSCLLGSVYAVVVCNDPASPSFRRWQAFTLSSANRLQLYVPPKHGNAYLVMSDISVYHYKQTTNYDRSSQFTLKWNDPALAIHWPVKDPILSERDD